VLPILETGVLINRRVESSDETRNWLATAASKNTAAVALDFKSHSAWAFKTPLTGHLIEYRLVENEPSADLQ